MIFSGGPSGVGSSSWIDFGRNTTPDKIFEINGSPLDLNGVSNEYEIKYFGLNNDKWALFLYSDCNLTFSKKATIDISAIGGGGRGQNGGGQLGPAGKGGDGGYIEEINTGVQISRGETLSIHIGQGATSSTASSASYILNSQNVTIISAAGGKNGGENDTDRTYGKGGNVSNTTASGYWDYAHNNSFTAYIGDGYSGGDGKLLIFGQEFKYAPGGGGGSAAEDIHNPSNANDSGGPVFHRSSSAYGGYGQGTSIRWGGRGGCLCSGYGGNSSIYPSDGTPNTGAGGGGGGSDQEYSGDGGSGVIIIYLH